MLYTITFLEMHLLLLSSLDSNVQNQQLCFNVTYSYDENSLT